MAKILIIAEHDGTTLNPSTAMCVACAATIGGAQIDIAILAASAEAVAAQARELDGVTTVRLVENAANEHNGAAGHRPGALESVQQRLRRGVREGALSGRGVRTDGDGLDAA